MRTIHSGFIHGREDPLIIEDETFLGEPKRPGIDNHAHTPDRMARPIVYLNCQFIANGAAEALKFSRHWHVTVIGGLVIGGVEDAVDIVRGGDIIFKGVTFQRGEAKQDVTCKGSARDVRFYDCPGLRKIVLGDFTKYDPLAIFPDGTRREVSLFRPLPRPPVRNVLVRSAKRVRVVRFHAEPAEGDVSDLSLRPFVKPYFFVRGRFFKETNPPPREELYLKPEEL